MLHLIIFMNIRLKKLPNYIDKNREFLDHSLKQTKKYKKTYNTDDAE